VVTATSGTAERVARNALLKGAVQATRLLSLAFVVLAARSLGPEGFGKFTFAYGLATILGVTLDLGMHSLLVRNIARARESTADYWAAAATLKLAILGPAGLVFAALPLLTARPLDTSLAVWLLGLAIALQSFIELSVTVFSGFERFEFEVGVRIVEKLVLVAVGIGGLWLGAGLLAATGAFVVAAAVSLALSAMLVHRRFASLRWPWDPTAARALARAVGPVAAAIIMGFASSRLIAPLVALFGGEAAAGYFGAAIRALDVTAVIPYVVVTAVYPALARLSPTDPRFRSAVVQAADLLVMIGLAIALVLGQGAPWLVAAVYGPAYAPAAPGLALLGAAAAMGGLANFLVFVLLALDQPRRIAIVAAASLATSLVLTPGLVLALGPLGGAIAHVVMSLVELAGMVVAVLPFVRMPFDRAALKAATAALGAGLAATGVPAGSGTRMVVALTLYVLGLVALKPLPAATWSRLWRGAAGVGDLVGGSR
jgi:O-antigen/teichoic acid export membrane protein